MTAGNGTQAAETVNRELSMLLGLVGILILLAVLAHLAARRQGGWRAVRRGMRREAALTTAAFTTPVRAGFRHRRHLRLLTLLLRQPSGWAVAERALLRAETVAAGVRGYAVLLGTDVVGVLVAGGPGSLPEPPEPWVVDERDPRLWWIDRTDVTGTIPAEAAAGADARETAPLLVALGVDGEYDVLAVLLDLTSGPAAMAVDGDPSTARAVLQSLAAQLDARLPTGALTVADGVHDRHSGPGAAVAVAAAESRVATAGGPAFAVCAVAPQDRRLPDGVRLIAAGGVRGLARLLAVDRDGGLLVHGTRLRVDTASLPRAVARAIGELPPYPTPGDPADDLAEPLPHSHDLARRSADGSRVKSPRPDTGSPADATTGKTTGTTTDARTVGVTAAGTNDPAVDDLSEPETPTRVAGVSVTGTP